MVLSACERVVHFKIAAILLQFLFFFPLSMAAPMSENPTSSTWLPYLIALLLFFLLCLLVLKMFFIRQRYASFRKGTKFMIQPRRTTLARRDGTTGRTNAFLIGFLGSPSLEIQLNSTRNDITFVRPRIKHLPYECEKSTDNSANSSSKESSHASFGPMKVPEPEENVVASMKNSASYASLSSRLTIDRGEIPTEGRYHVSCNDGYAALRLVEFDSNKEDPVCDDRNCSLGDREKQPKAAPFPLSLSLDSVPTAAAQLSGSDFFLERSDSQIPPESMKSLPSRYVRKASLSPTLSIINEQSMPELVTSKPSKDEAGSYPSPNDRVKEDICLESSFERIKSPPAAYTLYSPSRQKEKLKISFRNRRSPPAGASGLRPMMKTTAAGPNQVIIRHINDSPMLIGQTTQKNNSANRLGLGLSSIQLFPLSARETRPQDQYGANPKQGESVDDIFRELIEEAEGKGPTNILDGDLEAVVQRTEGLFESGSSSMEDAKYFTPKSSASPTSEKDSN